MSRVSIQKYKEMKINTAKNADPYELIKIVFVNIVGKLTAAKGFIDRNDPEKKGMLIGESITLFGALQDSLDMEQGGDISNNLFDLYEFAIYQLTQANVNNSKETIDEVLTITRSIQEAWEAIPTNVKDEYLEKQAVNG